MLRGPAAAVGARSAIVTATARIPKGWLMDDGLAAFLDKGLEFVVGGTIFLAALVFAAASFGYAPAESLVSGGGLAQITGGPLVVLMVVSAYAAGVLVESFCRFIFEWDLERVTVRHKPFAAAAKTPITKTSPGLRERVLGKAGPEGHFSRDFCGEAVRERERQRSHVMIRNVEFFQDVESQLKRLRLERIAAFSGVLLVLGFAARGEAGPLIVSVLATLVMFGLVHDRFRRYCAAISRSYERIDNDDLTVPATDGD